MHGFVSVFTYAVYMDELCLLFWSSYVMSRGAVFVLHVFLLFEHFMKQRLNCFRFMRTIYIFQK